MRKVKIVISWPKDAMFNPKAMKVFLSTDIHMSAKQLLNHYTNRWPIEVFFREGNRCLGMKKCQVHSQKQSLDINISLCYIFCVLEVQSETLGFSKRRSFYQHIIKKYHIAWIYHQSQNNADLDSLYKEFHVA